MLSPLRNRARRRLREPFGKAGLTVAVIALVFAMLGGAYAAGGLNAKQKKEVKAIAKSFQGTGPAGAAGPAGAKGDTGAAGAKGDTGAKGEKGEKGEKGPKGDKGEKGDPWTAGGTLPVGSTETGAWNIKMVSGAGETSLSFPIPLATAINGASTKVNSFAAGTGTTTSGSTEITGLTHTANTQPWATLTPITGPGIPAGTQITEVISPTEIVISQAATASAAGVALSSTVWSQCDDGAAPAATAEHPEADSGFLCVFVARGTGPIPGLIPFRSGTASEGGASTAGDRLSGGSFTLNDSVAGTFAVTG